MTTPFAAARVGGALLLEEGTWQPRALWQGRAARAVVWEAAGEDGAALAGAALAIGTESGAGEGTAGKSVMSPVRVAGQVPDDRVVVVYEQPSGVALTEVLAAAEAASQRFPVDVACRLALYVASLTTWLPRLDDLTITWDGRLRASPVPRMPGGHMMVLSQDIRFLSPSVVRAEAPAPAADALYCAGVLLFELLTGQAPFTTADHEGAHSTMQMLLAIVQGDRTPLLRLRPDLDESLGALVDGLVAAKPAVSGEGAPTATHTRAVLGARASSSEDAVTFLAGLLRETFAERCADDVEFWEQAATLSAASAPEWPLTPVAPTRDILAAVRRLESRSSRDD